jgi:hypothetical protein
LRAEGVTGVEDLDRFVNNTKHLAPSRFDSRAAMPVLLRLLPTLTDRKAVEATARHLHGAWARPSAFDALEEAFRTWAPHDALVAWTIGDSLALAATFDDLDVLLDFAENRQYGQARQMIVYSLWRFGKDLRVVDAIRRLTEDPDVCLHAMTALRRAVGNEAAMLQLCRVRDEHPDQNVRKQAARAVKNAQRSLVRHQYP